MSEEKTKMNISVNIKLLEEVYKVDLSRFKEGGTYPMHELMDVLLHGSR